MVRLLLVLLPALLEAEYLKIEITFGGMECASCTGFLETRFARNRNVKSVQVDKQKSVLTLELKPENKLQLELVRDQVQQSGFTPKQTLVTVRGTVLPNGLLVAGIGQTLATTDPKALLAPHAGKTVRVEGEVKPAPDRTLTFEVRKAESAE